MRQLLIFRIMILSKCTYEENNKEYLPSQKAVFLSLYHYTLYLLGVHILVDMHWGED